jgi:alkaline phosphatase
MSSRRLIAPILILAPLLLGADRSGPARNAVLFIGDGMGVSTMTAARLYAAGAGGRLAMELPHTALVRTYSLDRMVSDSAATATAILSGEKVESGILGMSVATRRGCSRPERLSGGPNPVHPCAPDARPVASLADLALRAGMAVGVVTTTRITHATPAALYAHVDDRDREDEIARQLVERADLAFLAGGGRRHFLPRGSAGEGQRTDGRDLLAELAQRGYAVARDGAALERAAESGAARIAALLAPDHLPFELERRARHPEMPSLADLTEAAIRHLGRHAGGYLLLVEGGRIDHAQHVNLAQLALEDVLAFDAAIGRARELTRAEETLLLVTADHGHPLVIAGYALVDDSVLGLARSGAGLVHVDADEDGKPDFARAADGKAMTVLLFGNGPGHGGDAGPGSPREDPATLGDALQAPDYMQESAVPLPGSTHEGSDVVAAALGPGAESVRGFLDNTDLFRLSRAALGL